MKGYMSSLESPSDADIAEELAAAQRSISIAEFFEKNKHMLGFDSGARALVTAVKEATDNSLDAAEEAGILPDIYINISESRDLYTLVIEDNGPGITKEQVPKVFGKLLYGSRFHARQQARGQQGIGISAAVLYSQLTSGKPARITSRTQGSSEAQYFELIIDTDENEPEIRTAETTTWDRPHGTRIELDLEANMRARQQLHDYVKQTAVVNPHARIELHEPNADMKFERATDQLPDETEEIRPHPHGVELGTVLKMLGATDSHSVSGFLQGEFTRVGRKTADDIIDGFRDRHFGRELTWEPPAADADATIAPAVADATANKGKATTEAFAEAVDERLTAVDRLAHHQVVGLVDDVADEIEDELDVRLGATVRDNAATAAWETITANVEGQLYAIVDDATSERKDDRVIEGVATRFAEALADTDYVDHRHRLRDDQLEELVDRVADMTADVEDVAFGATARGNIVEALWTRMRTVPDEPPKVRELADDRDAASALVEGMRTASIMAPPTDCLAPISADLLEEGLRKEFDADFFAATTRDGQVHAGDPFIVEAGIAYGGELTDDSPVDVLRFANRVPLVYQRGACATTDVLRSIGWRNYGLDQPGGSGLPHGPAVIMVHVASTNVPFTSESKDAVANIPAIEDEIELAVRECARELKTYLNRRRSLAQRRQKQDVLARILPRMATKVANVTARDQPNIDDTLARIMNNVLVDRVAEGESVTVSVENHSDRGEELSITEIVDAEPRELSDGATVQEVDGEWFVRWSAAVDAGESASYSYTTDAETSAELVVDDIDEELVTVTNTEETG